MNERTRKKLIFATLPIAVVWAVFNIPSEKKQPVISQPVPLIQAERPTEPAIPMVAGLINVQERATQTWGEDPFRTNLYKSGSPGGIVLRHEWELKGIVYSEDNPLAFVNRRSVRVGDTVNEAKVIAINKKSVILKFEDQEITLTVNKG